MSGRLRSSTTARGRRRGHAERGQTTEQIDDALASLALVLTAEEVEWLEAPYTPRDDFQGISDDRQLAAIAARVAQFTTAEQA